MSKNKRREADPYAGIRRDNPPPDFKYKNRVLYSRKPRKHIRNLIQKELEQYLLEKEENI